MTEVREQSQRAGSWKGEGGNIQFLILEGEFGLIPIEIKYTQTVPSKQLRALRDFIKDQNCRFGLVINNNNNNTNFIVLDQKVRLKCEANGHGPVVPK